MTKRCPCCGAALVRHVVIGANRQVKDTLYVCHNCKELQMSNSKVVAGADVSPQLKLKNPLLDIFTK